MSVRSLTERAKDRGIPDVCVDMPVAVSDALEDDPGAVLCPRCRLRHRIHGNFDDLCDRCIRAILTDHPDHESVPFIKEAARKWRTNYAQARTKKDSENRESE